MFRYAINVEEDELEEQLEEQLEELQEELQEEELQQLEEELTERASTCNPVPKAEKEVENDFKYSTKLVKSDL